MSTQMPEGISHLGAAVIKSSIDTAIRQNTPIELSKNATDRVKIARDQIASKLPPIEGGQFLENLMKMDDCKNKYDQSKKASDQAINIIAPLLPDGVDHPGIQVLRNEAEKQYEAFISLFDISVHTDFLYAISQKAGIDSHTGLFIRSTLMDEIKRTAYDEWMKNPEGVKLGNFEILALDMENFKIGNELLGHEGFDGLIKEMADRFISMSQYLSVESPGTQPYRSLGPDKKQSKDTISKNFPPQSPERALLDDAKERGILVEFYRDRAGGDEALVYVKYTQEKNDENQKIAKQLINVVFGKTELPKHTNDKDLRDLNEIAMNTIPNKLQLYGSYHNEAINLIRTMGGLSIEEYPPEKIHHFIGYLNSIAGYVRSLIPPNPISHSTPALRMGATFAVGNLDQAMSKFLFGINADGTMEPGAGLLTLRGDLNTPNKDKYIAEIGSNTQLITEAIGFADSQLIDNIIQSEATLPISKGFISDLFRQVEENKKHTKNQAMIDALKGDSDKLYQVSASEKAGRSIGDKQEREGDISHLDLKDRLAILMMLEKHYRGVYEEYKNDILDQSDPLYNVIHDWKLHFTKNPSNNGNNVENQEIYDQISHESGDMYMQMTKGYE